MTSWREKKTEPCQCRGSVNNIFHQRNRATIVCSFTACCKWMASRHNAPTAPMSLSAMCWCFSSYLLLRETLQPCFVFQQMSRTLSVHAGPQKYRVFQRGSQCYNETPTETEIGYASSWAAISYIMLLYIHLALSIIGGGRPICIMGREENGMTLPVSYTYLTFGFWWRKASASPWRCFRSRRTPPAPCGEQ